jgi:hypothetical protein
MRQSKLDYILLRLHQHRHTKQFLLHLCRHILHHHHQKRIRLQLALLLLVLSKHQKEDKYQFEETSPPERLAPLRQSFGLCRLGKSGAW